jgi:energy-coupling factor transporter ATP-binding protein EcfA2
VITGIEIRGFRALRAVDVRLSAFQVLVGPNASGKSTFFDALAFVRDVMQVGLEAAIFGNARFDVPMRAADPLELTWRREGGPVEIAVEASVPEELRSARSPYRRVRYELSVDLSKDLRFVNETLWLCPDEHAPVGSPRQRELFPDDYANARRITHTSTPKGWRKTVSKTDTGNDYFKAENSDWNNMFRFGPSKSALANLPEDEQRFPLAIWFKRLLMEETYVLSLNAEAMRLPSPAGSSSRLLPDGSNLPWAVHALESTDTGRLGDWVAHIRTSLRDIRAIRTREKPEDRSRYVEVEYATGLNAPSWLLSDGTLRMLALTIIAYAPKPPGTILIEEPENGIHPQAIETVIQSLQSVYDAQVFLATHSPIVLSLLHGDQLLCFGKTNSGAIDIVAGVDHPSLKAWKSAVHLGDLLATGVLG